MGYSDFVVYVDESGDHGLMSVNPDYPVFSLAFCIFRKESYTHSVVPRVQALKFRYWGHDSVVLRSYDIRKGRHAFSFLNTLEKKSRFLGDLSELVEQSEFTLVASVIKKSELKNRYHNPGSPYDIALQFCLERLYAFLREQDQLRDPTHVVIEQRGPREDSDLMRTFERVVNGDNRWGPIRNLELVFVPKAHNSTGLQFADLVANPIGTHVLHPDRRSQAYEVVERKFRRSPTGRTAGWGLKVFP